MLARRLALAALAASALSAVVPVAHAAGPVYVEQASSSVWWGANGDHAVMLLQYDSAAKIPVVVSNIGIIDVGGDNLIVSLSNCGTPVKQGETLVGFSLNPGNDCFLRASRAGANSAMVGQATITDATGKAANINTYVRTMLEIRDANENVVTHVEVR